MSVRSPGRDEALQFCDLTCRFASFPEEDAVDGANSCRTFAALYCAKKKRYVHKNMPCAERVRREEKSSPGKGPGRSRGKKGRQ